MFRRANSNIESFSPRNFLTICDSYKERLERNWYDAAADIDRICKRGEVNASEGAKLQELKWVICRDQLWREYQKAVDLDKNAYSVSFNQRIPYLRSFYCVKLRIERITCHGFDERRLTAESMATYGWRYEQAQTFAGDFVFGDRECDRAKAKIQKQLHEIPPERQDLHDQLNADLEEVRHMTMDSH